MTTMHTGPVLRQIDQLFGAGTVAGLSDAQLLGRFRTHRDEAAFVGLVARHGPMVMTVCRGVLRDPHAAEDAFQATFLILVRKAGTLWVRDSVAGWLHRVAHRVALQARADELRRRARERATGEAAMVKGDEREPHEELRALLHAEIGRLPDRFRLPVVLCDLEGLTRDQAAERLRWTEGRLRGRLAKARSLLRQRLVRRGVEIPVAGLVAALASETASAAVPVPTSLLAAVARLGTSQAAGATVAALSARVIRSFLLARLKRASIALFAAVAVTGTSAVLLAVAVRWAAAVSDEGAARTTLPFREDLPVEGRVVDLEGRPVAGAVVKVAYVWAPRSGDLTPWLQAIKAKEADIYTIRNRYLSQTVEIGGRVEMLDPVLVPPATTDAHGEFRLTGIGRERLAELNIEAAGIRSTTVEVMTRRGEAFQVRWDPHGPDANKVTIHGASIQLAVAPSRPIEGIVRDRATGAPLAGVTITSYAFADEHILNNTEIGTTSDAAGRYRIVGMPRGSGNQLSASAPPEQPYLPVVEAIEDPPGLGPVHHDIALTRGVAIEGRVTGKTRDKSVSAYVYYHVAADNPELELAPGFRLASSGANAFRASTKPDGSYKIVGLPGRGLLLVEALERTSPGIDRSELAQFAGYVPDPTYRFYHAYARIDVPRGIKAFPKDLRIDPGRSLPGTVLDAAGKPLAGAVVYGLFSLGDWTQLGGPSFEVQAIATRGAGNPAMDSKNAAPSSPPRTLVFQHDAQKLAGWLEVDPASGGPLRVRLEPWAAASGRIVDEEGNPRVDLSFLIGIPDKPRLGGGYITHRPERVRTDADGRFRIEGLAPGLTYRLFPTAPNGKWGRRINFTPKSAGEERDLGTVAIEFVDPKF